MALYTDDPEEKIQLTENNFSNEAVSATKKAHLPKFHIPYTATDMINAKAYLSVQQSDNNDIYSHMADILKYIFTFRPENALTNFEGISEEVKRFKYSMGKLGLDTLRDVNPEPTEVTLAKLHKGLFPKRKVPEEVEGGDKVEENEEEDADDEDSPLPNMLEMVFYFEQTGIGLGRDEMLKLWSAMRKFSKQKELTKLRFWGKIFGLEQNYYILEVEPVEDEEAEAEAEEEAEQPAAEPVEEPPPEDEEGANEEKEPPLPKNKWKPPPKIPPEARREGANRPVFYVTSTLGTGWKRLPDVTPQQIIAARLFRKFFTGRLDAPVVAFPPFPGKEINLLRVQVARIHASTQISPAGYFEVDEDEELEEGAIPQTLITAEEFDDVDLEELCDPSQAGWAHHGLRILQQGRCQWIDAKKAAKEAAEEEEETPEEEEEEVEEAEPEEGPELLAPIGEDEPLSGAKDELTAWRVEKVGKMVPKYAICAVHSNRWPGAHAFALGKKWENVYIGWGLKYNADNHNPLTLPKAEREFNDTGVTDLIEVTDPTPEEEAALRELLKKPEPVEEEEQGEGAGEEEEEED